jgi:hypothetical protein
MVQRLSLFASWSISDPVSFDAGFGWWQEFGLVVVRIDADLPRGMMDNSMMVPAEKHEVVHKSLI